MNEALHQPVMLEEAIELLQVKPNQWYLDGTFGRGGHTSKILSLGGKVVAFDQDPEAIEYGTQTFDKELQAGTLILVRENFQKLSQHSPHQNYSGILFDFGTSVDQLTSTERGFSFQDDGPLDMRMDPSLGVTAADLLNALPEKQLKQLFQEFGGEREAGKLARAIARQREKAPFATTKQLTQLISKTKSQKTNLDPSTKVFQALRIAVNSELQAIEAALPQAFELLQPGARLVTLSFHDGEDRLVKHFIKDLEANGFGENLTPKPLEPSKQEVTINPRARSAKLRAVQKK